MSSVERREPTPEISPPRPWTSKEIARLRELADLGLEAVADMLERSPASVRMQASRQRISLRPAGVRGGRFLGQVAGLASREASEVAMLRQLREDVLAGRVDVARMERRARAIALGISPCPSCSIRPVEVETTGFCLDCHKRWLADAHALEAGTFEADRELDRERQRKHRSRRRAGGKDSP